jgi:2-polyprenyl-3-methyl-5-hydroxy-6-metoxy-1,4-benzoquinol methylase
MKNNTPQLWDNVWKITPPEQDKFYLAREAQSVRWHKIKQKVLAAYGTFEGLKAIEIGAGAGTYAALMAREGAKVYILDYSEKALEKARTFFERNGVDAEYILQDALNLPADMQGKYDISMSFGLTEHFLGQNRMAINRAHLDLLRPGGMTFISVPNKYNLPYRMYMFAAQLTGKWLVGEEYPYSRRELLSVCRDIKGIDCQVFGESLYQSNYFLGLLNPFRIFAKFVLKRQTDARQDQFDITRIKPEKSTCFDDHLSYALVLYCRKPSEHAVPEK